MPLKMYRASPTNVIKSTLAIAAGKGGVGKSTITVNLALALKAQGFQVGIMDTDIYGPSIRKMLREDRLPSEKNGFIEPALSHGIKIVSIAYFKKEHAALVVRAPIANQLISKFMKQVNWGKLDFLLIDFPPGTGDVQLTLCQQAHLTAAIMVTTPQEIALLDVRKAIKMFDLVKVPILGIVENMSFYQQDVNQEKIYLFGKGGGERLSIENGSPFLGAIPLNPVIGQCGDQGDSLFDLNSTAESAIQQTFTNLARSVVNETEALSENESFIDQIEQKNAYSVTIKWKNGSAQEMSLSEIQKNCPCANCINEITGQRLLDLKTIKKDVRAVSIRQVGRYALQFQFTSGCSTGIYSFDCLMQMSIKMETTKISDKGMDNE